MRAPPRFIVGATWRQAGYWLHRPGSVAVGARILDDVRGLVGVRGGTLYLCGTYYERPDWPEIVARARAIGMTTVGPLR